MNDKGDMTLTPSSALQDEITKRLLEAWEAARGSEAGMGEFPAMVTQAKERVCSSLAMAAARFSGRSWCGPLPYGASLPLRIEPMAHRTPS